MVIGIGHIFMGLNTLHKFMVVVGPSRSGKSTLMALLGRIFNASRIPTQKIVANERFTLIDLIDKDVNLDDDINNGIMKGIGNLNSVVEGQPLKIEMKGINEHLSLTNTQIPRLVANGNSLPPVIGEGFDTRLLLIKAPNKKPMDKRDETLQGKIYQGEYDPELEWLVYETITTYWKYIDNKESLLTPKEEDQQSKDYQFQSYPLLVAIESLFTRDWETDQTIPVKDVNKYVLMWSEWAYQKNTADQVTHK